MELRGNDLNMQLYNACSSDPVDYSLVKKLLANGANPLGKICIFNSIINVYDGVLDYYFDANTTLDDISEDLYLITELFLRYGMDLSKAEIPYDDDNYDSCHPLWMFGFPANDVVTRTLKLFLDYGVSAEDAGECWGHMYFDYVCISSDFRDNHEIEMYGEFIKKLMLIASYPHILENDEELKEAIWYGYQDNTYDLSNFRNWNDYEYEIDTSHCKNHPEAYRSIVTIIEKQSKQPVWKLGLSIRPDEL